MPSRRSQINMSDAEVEAYLVEQTVLNVATNGPSGHPHVVAMWYAYHDGERASGRSPRARRSSTSAATRR